MRNPVAPASVPVIRLSLLLVECSLGIQDKVLLSQKVFWKCPYLVKRNAFVLMKNRLSETSDSCSWNFGIFLNILN